MDMLKIVLGLACLCCMANGDRRQKVESDAQEQRQLQATDLIESTQSVAEVSEDSSRVNAHDKVTPLSKLAVLLTCLGGAAAFSPVPGSASPAKSSNMKAGPMVPNKWKQQRLPWWQPRSPSTAISLKDGSFDADIFESIVSRLYASGSGVGSEMQPLLEPSDLQAHDDARKSGGQITFQYSPSSLKHLEATELPDDYSRPWTPQKVRALGGAILLGALAAAAGEYAALSFVEEADDAKLASLLLGAVGSAAGYYLSGGKRVEEAERAVNGGYDRKLVQDKPARLRSVLRSLHDRLDTVVRTNRTDLPPLALRYIRAVHGRDYVDAVRTKSLSTDRPVRFNPRYARTLVDSSTYAAAVHSVADWMESVDSATGPDRGVKFALTRPPGHHACRNKAMGGCFFNSAAVAAFYALDRPGVGKVAILDIDAHHGNGVAHCVQDETRIRYCSIHEARADGYTIGGGGQRLEDDPRGPADDDRGPSGNVRNINLKSGTGWGNGYEEALVNEALPFLTEGGDPDLLIVAAGFDAVASDMTSRLTLDPDDYGKIGDVLYRRFGNAVAFGLEGGYSWEEQDLSRALIAFVEPWRKGL